MVILFAGFTALYASGADKEEEKARETAVAFLKAVKAKDIDAVMKTVDVPFLFDVGGKSRLVTKSEDLRTMFKTFLGKVTPGKVPTDVGTVHNWRVLRKMAEDAGETETVGAIEKVLGKEGYAVAMGTKGKEIIGILVRIKDGKAVVVGVPK